MKTIFLLGSESDKDFTLKITDKLTEWGIPFEVLVASAHKVPEKVFEIVDANNKSDDELVYVTIAGRSNGLSGVTAANSVHPVIACPPHSSKEDFMVNINSTLVMPSDTPVLTVLDPGNCALAVARIFAVSNPELRSKVADKIAEIKKSFE
ncbi:AIR carboxylase family protein [Candidatus Peregrinibacteria bacterium]|jgi:phosphoribosylaminoimidazole carboxylase PurE protein|nr:AIR carboxylase family protein [Candidatus Peregrinibacteria bacterium]MBT7736969.1 AIR carboxylase family protein [Candidatus Peregrinibacteria bacterium]